MSRFVKNAEEGKFDSLGIIPQRPPFSPLVFREKIFVLDRVWWACMKQGVTAIVERFGGMYIHV